VDAGNVLSSFPAASFPKSKTLPQVLLNTRQISLIRVHDVRGRWRCHAPFICRIVAFD
jgi:hypothetical protein